MAEFEILKSLQVQAKWNGVLESLGTIFMILFRRDIFKGIPLLFVFLSYRAQEMKTIETVQRKVHIWLEPFHSFRPAVTQGNMLSPFFSIVTALLEGPVKKRISKEKMMVKKLISYSN